MLDVTDPAFGTSWGSNSRPRTYVYVVSRPACPHYTSLLTLNILNLFLFKTQQHI
jgi:hypothetical protein